MSNQDEHCVELYNLVSQETGVYAGKRGVSGTNFSGHRLSIHTTEVWGLAYSISNVLYISLARRKRGVILKVNTQTGDTDRLLEVDGYRFTRLHYHEPLERLFAISNKYLMTFDMVDFQTVYNLTWKLQPSLSSLKDFLVYRPYLFLVSDYDHHR